MPSSILTIEFAAIKKICLHPESTDINIESIPDWAKFVNMSCPGNIEHGPTIDFCRLGVEIEKLVNYFSNIKSIECGILTMHYDEHVEIRFASDAQTIFYNSLWFILLYSNCSVFKHGQWARINYIPSSEPDRLFYMLFSIFLVEDFVATTNSPINIDKFKAQLCILRNVLNNLLDRLRKSSDLKADAVGNGLVLFSNLLLILDIEFEEFYTNIEEKIKKNNVLGNWV